MDQDGKLILAFALLKRTTEVACRLMGPLQKRITRRPIIVMDALETYIDAVQLTFGTEVDYTMVTKEFGHGTVWVKPYPIMGKMDRKDMSTSKIERPNLPLRNFVRRLNRKTLCFSNKPQNPRAALSLHFFWYDFGRIHGTLSCTPAMEACLAELVWTVDQLLPAKFLNSGVFCYDGLGGMPSAISDSRLFMRTLSVLTVGSTIPVAPGGIRSHTNVRSIQQRFPGLR